ncbi:hypothetical protein [Gluconobacter kondonii]|uniref:hypothetical protein n=1 Tax=Gluconobacter kondonii TaxID=941463 RepID=UPI001B8C4DE6|nr:hypothetical protein [Gluconobacter kondonii]MBS1058036.1 hypothetical protein [Gluconobacter kondonii]
MMAHPHIPDPDHMDICLAADEPAEVKALRPVLEQATEALYEALQRYEMWRVLAQDEALHSRLGQQSFAHKGFFQLRGMVFDALVVALTRMFDRPMNGHNPLSLVSLGKSVSDAKGLCCANTWKGFPV